MCGCRTTHKAFASFISSLLRRPPPLVTQELGRIRQGNRDSAITIPQNSSGCLTAEAGSIHSGESFLTELTRLETV